MSLLDTDRYFFIAFILIFTSLTLIRFYFRITTGDIQNILFNHGEGLVPIILRSLFGVILAWAVLMYIFFPQQALWSYCSLPDSLQIIGIAFASFVLTGIYLSHRELGKNFSSCLVIRKEHQLIYSGPYDRVY